MSDRKARQTTKGLLPTTARFETLTSKLKNALDHSSINGNNEVKEFEKGVSSPKNLFDALGGYSSEDPHYVQDLDSIRNCSHHNLESP